MSPAAHDLEVLRLQRLAGNAAVAGLLAKTPRQRVLDDTFKRGGTPTAKQLADCRAFAKQVSDFVDQAYLQLMAGDVKEWHGTKISTFLDMLQRDSRFVLPWAGNAIEERVYALMAGTKMGLDWVPQFAEGMGGASKPDIVVTLSEDPVKQALIDITSDRFHIMGKAGGWTTSERYVYVAEAWFPPVMAEHLETIRAGVKAGGLSAAEVEKRIAAANAERERVIAARNAVLVAARTEYNDRYGTVARLAEGKFGGDRKAAVAWMRANGLGQAKGVPKLKGKKKPAPETKLMMRRRAAKAKAGALAAAHSHHDESSMAVSGKPSRSGKDVMDEEAGSEIDEALTKDGAGSDIEDELEEAEELV